MPDPVRSPDEFFQFYRASTCNTLNFLGILERIAVSLLVAPRSPTGPSSSPGTLWTRPRLTESGEAFFENARFTKEFMFCSRWFGVIFLYFSSIVYRSAIFYRA